MGSVLLGPSGRSDRGVGIKYGPDVTTKFCSQNRLRYACCQRTCVVSFTFVALLVWQVSGQKPSSARRWARTGDGECKAPTVKMT